MRLIPLQSSNLSGVSYNISTDELFVQFTNGTLYVYHDVPPESVCAFLFGESQGKLFNAIIKSGPFSYEKIENPEEYELDV